METSIARSKLFFTKSSSSVFLACGNCLYSGTTFLGSEGNACGGAASAHVLLCQLVLALLTPVLVSLSPLPLEHRREAIFLEQVGCLQKVRRTGTQKTHIN